MGCNKQTMFEGEVYSTLYNGKLKIIRYIYSTNIVVEFLDTGTRVSTNAYQIHKGKVKDPNRPSVCGIGFIGEGLYGVFEGKVKSKGYRVWNSMLARCYDPNCKEYKRYGAKGITVCTEWLNYQNFAEWYKANYFEGAQIDKDLNQGNIYSPLNCEMLTQKDNTILAHAISCQLLSPEGILTDVYNLAEFARKHGVDPSALSKVRKGKRKHCKGWKVP